MIFITVGTSFPFDRLIKKIDDSVSKGLVNNTFFAQVGLDGYRPKNFDSVEIMSKDAFDTIFLRADAIISHAGMGTISMALELGKPVLVMPRLKEYGELVNEHQYITAKRFEKLGHVISAYYATDLIKKIHELKTFKPVLRESDAESVSKRIGKFITESEKMSLDKHKNIKE